MQFLDYNGWLRLQWLIYINIYIYKIIAEVNSKARSHSLTLLGSSVQLFRLHWYEGPAKCFVTGFVLLQCYVLSNIFLLQKKVREKSRDCHNHKPQPFPDPKRKRNPTNPNKHKSNKRTKSSKISSLFPKRGNRNTKD